MRIRERDVVERQMVAGTRSWRRARRGGEREKGRLEGGRIYGGAIKRERGRVRVFVSAPISGKR